MKRSKLIPVVLGVASAVIIGGIGWYQSSYADTQQSAPGSTNDPIVTKSYVDQKLAEITGGTSAEGSGGSSKLEVVTVDPGKKIIVADGGELIVRSGKAVAYSTDANGLSDMTDGLDIAPGKVVGNNHLILFPRGGRGVQPDPNQKNGLIVLVRGNYTIE